MRIKPAVDQEEAYRLLSLNAALVWGLEEAAGMDTHLRAIAQSMSVISALDIPDEVEPLFGEDIGKHDEVAA
jgi:hypothetical protein